MLHTLGFKQGLADFVLDAMGKASDFERQNTEQAKGRKKESAFMQRLASVMGEAVQGLDMPRPVESVRVIVEQCRLMWK